MKCRPANQSESIAMSAHHARIGLVAAAVIVAAVCLVRLPAAGSADINELRKYLNKSQVLALQSRQRAVDDGFAAFRKKTCKEPFTGGVYIVNGDTPVLDEKELRAFYDREGNGRPRSSACRWGTRASR